MQSGPCAHWPCWSLPLSKRRFWTARQSAMERSLDLQNSGAPRPSGDIALEERSEVVCAEWEFLSSIADPREVQVYDWVDQPAKHHLAISARGQHERGNDCNALTGLHHRNLRIEMVENSAGLEGDSHSRQMLVDELLDQIAWRQRDQRLSLQGRPRVRSAAQRRVVIGANHHQRKAKQRRSANPGCGLKERAQAHIKFALLNHQSEGVSTDIQHSNSDVGPMTAEFLDGLWQNVGRDQWRRAHGQGHAGFRGHSPDTRHGGIELFQALLHDPEQFLSVSGQTDVPG